MVYITWNYLAFKIFIKIFLSRRPPWWRSRKWREVKNFFGILFSTLKVHHIWWAKQYLQIFDLSSPLSVMVLETFDQWLSKYISNIHPTYVELYDRPPEHILSHSHFQDFPHFPGIRCTCPDYVFPRLLFRKLSVRSIRYNTTMTEISTKISI